MGRKTQPPTGVRGLGARAGAGDTGPSVYGVRHRQRQGAVRPKSWGGGVPASQRLGSLCTRHPPRLASPLGWLQSGWRFHVHLPVPVSDVAMGGPRRSVLSWALAPGSFLPGSPRLWVPRRPGSRSRVPRCPRRDSPPGGEPLLALGSSGQTGGQCPLPRAHRK